MSLRVNRTFLPGNLMIHNNEESYCSPSSYKLNFSMGSIYSMKVWGFGFEITDINGVVLHVTLPDAALLELLESVTQPRLATDEEAAETLREVN